jgi:malate synthase
VTTIGTSAATIQGPAVDRADEVLTPDALDFAASLPHEFGPRRDDLLERRRERQVEFDEGALPDFLPETEHVRAGEWKVAPPPPALRDRRVRGSETGRSSCCPTGSR